MRVNPAVAAAGSIALPKDIIACNSTVYMTAPHDQLESDTSMYAEYGRNYSIVYSTSGRQLHASTFYAQGVEKLLPELCRYYSQVHIVRTAGKYSNDDIIDYNRDLQRNPWRNYDWFRNHLHRWAEHFIAPSKTIAGRLAYYQSVDKRVRDIQTPIKAGRYLTKYFGDLLTQEEIQRHGLEWEAAFGPVEVHITQDSDTIEAVYESAHHGSCMWFNGDKSYKGSCHPARVYGGNLDLGIAYIGTTEVDGILGRCLVWPEKKIYLDKLYGDDFRLKIALENLGYKADDGEGFTGARLRRIRHGHYAYVLPYIDTHENVRDNGEYLILDDDGDIGCQNSEFIYGLSVHDEDDEPFAECYDCGDDIDDAEDATYVTGRGNCCNSCRYDNHFYCEESSDYYHDDDRARTPEHWAVAESSVKRNPNWFHCEYTDMYYPFSEYDRVELVEGDHCVANHAEKNGYYCIAHDKWSLQSSKQVELSDGSSVHLDYFDNLAEFNAFIEERGLTVDSPPLSLSEAA